MHFRNLALRAITSKINIIIIKRHSGQYYKIMYIYIHKFANLADNYYFTKAIRMLTITISDWYYIILIKCTYHLMKMHAPSYL